MGVGSRQRLTAALPPGQFHCLLDELPLHLIPQLVLRNTWTWEPGSTKPRLRAIDDALKRLHTGEYGECVDCGEDIPFSRLHAVPTATRCTRCEASQEFAEGNVARHTL